MTAVTTITPNDIAEIRVKAQDCLNKAENADIKLRHKFRQLLSDLWTFIRITEGVKQYDDVQQEVADGLHDKLTTGMIALLLSHNPEVEALKEVEEEKKDDPIYNAFTARFDANKDSHRTNLAIGIHELMRHVNRLPRFKAGEEYAGTDGAGNRFIAFMTIHGVFVMWRDINSTQILYFCEPAVSAGEHFNGMFKTVGAIETMDQVNKVFALA